MGPSYELSHTLERRSIKVSTPFSFRIYGLIISIALKILWRTGRNHRNISTGKIYWDSANECGDLSGFEYDKKYDLERQSDVKTVRSSEPERILRLLTNHTGTPDFWSVNTGGSMYCFKGMNEFDLRKSIQTVSAERPGVFAFLPPLSIDPAINMGPSSAKDWATGLSYSLDDYQLYE